VLISSEEMLNVKDIGEYYVIHPALPELHQFEPYGNGDKEYSSDSDVMNLKEVCILLEREKLL
jgi:hypothetical protein